MVGRVAVSSAVYNRQASNMDFKSSNSKNVWENKLQQMPGGTKIKLDKSCQEGRRSSWTNPDTSLGTNPSVGSSTAFSLSKGPFGSSISSGSFSGPASLPSLQKEKAKLFSFEIGSTSSGSTGLPQSSQQIKISHAKRKLYFGPYGL